MTAEAWGIAFDDWGYRRIAHTDLGDGRSVSTIWLGLDHGFGEGPPMIFESMAFKKSGKKFREEIDCERYSTEEEARAGHEAMVARLRAETDETKGPK